MKKEISYQVSLEEDENKLEQVLRRSLELSPREIRRAKFRPQGICVNGVRRRVTETVRQGERITVCLEEEGDGRISWWPWQENCRCFMRTGMCWL